MAKIDNLFLKIISDEQLTKAYNINPNKLCNVVGDNCAFVDSEWLAHDADLEWVGLWPWEHYSLAVHRMILGRLCRRWHSI